MAWNPIQYLKFKGERLRPAIDLITQTRSAFENCMNVQSILDLGCGPGNLTEYLGNAFPNATIDGIDSSESMIECAMKNSINSKMTFRKSDIESEINDCTKKYNLVFSNASLHWCNDHDKLLTNIINNKLIVGNNSSALAIQMPDTRSQTSHLLFEEAAKNCGLSKFIIKVRIPRIEKDPCWYYSFLSPICKSVNMWSTDYIQQLKSEDNDNFNPVLNFVRSTGLKPILDALGGEDSDICHVYLEEYNRLLNIAYPTTNVKKQRITLLPYKRFFIVCKV